LSTSILHKSAMLEVVIFCEDVMSIPDKNLPLNLQLCVLTYYSPGIYCR